MGEEKRKRCKYLFTDVISYIENPKEPSKTNKQTKTNKVAGNNPSLLSSRSINPPELPSTSSFFCSSHTPSPFLSLSFLPPSLHPGARVTPLKGSFLLALKVPPWLSVSLRLGHGSHCAGSAPTPPTALSYQRLWILGSGFSASFLPAPLTQGLYGAVPLPRTQLPQLSPACPSLPVGLCTNVLLHFPCPPAPTPTRLAFHGRDLWSALCCEPE